MKDLADGMESELRNLKESMAEHARATGSYFEGVMAHAEHMKSKFHGTFESLSNDVLVSLLTRIPL